MRRARELAILLLISLLYPLRAGAINAALFESMKERLHSTEASTRQSAIASFESMGPDVYVVPLIADVLAKDPSDFVRRQAAQTLGALISGIPSVELGLRKEDVHTATDPSPKLRESDRKAVNVLVQAAAQDSQRGVQMAAIDALMRIRPPADVVVPSFLRLLEQNDFFRIRRMTSDAIRLYGPAASKSESSLRIVLLREPEARVRIALLNCLNSFGSLSRDTINALSDIGRHDADWSVRTTAIKMLTARGHDAKPSEVDQALARYPESKQDYDLLLEVVRSTSPGVNEPFASEESWWGTRDRARALERLSQPTPAIDFKDAYLSLLDDPDTSLRTIAATAQWKLKDKRAVKKIRPLLATMIREADKSTAPVMTMHGIFLARSLIALDDCDSIREIVYSDKLLPMVGSILTSCKSEARPHLLKRSKEPGPMGQYAKNWLRYFYGPKAPAK